MKFFDFLNGPNGEQSSKRVFTLILMILWTVYFFANLFYGKALKSSLEEYLFYMVVVAYGGVALERLFSGRGKQDSTSTVIKKEETTVKKEGGSPEAG